MVMAKMTVKNQLTLPKRIAAQFLGTRYFAVETSRGRITLTPMKIEKMGRSGEKADAVRGKLAALGIGEKEIADAVAWARRK